MATQPDKDSYTDWWQPAMKGFRFACCDCGLVHDMQFRVLKILKRHRGGTFDVELASGHKVQFRLRRNARATAAKRRTRKKV